jgi:hypothetical protein
MIFLIILRVFTALIYLMVIGQMLYAVVAVYNAVTKRTALDGDAILGLILWFLIGMTCCNEIKMRTCERIEEREVACCVDYEYGRSGRQCIDDGICIKEICVD